MSTLSTKSIFSILLCLAFIVLNISACSDSTDPDPNPPVLPPASSMEMDLSSLTNSETAKLSLNKTVDNSSMMAGSNWAYAAGTVAFWATVTNLTLALPTAAFVATITQDPEYMGDMRWKWTNNFLGYHTAELYGEINGSVVEWEMYISRTGGFQNFLWFTGESNLDGTGGTWTFNKSVEEPVAYLGVEWNRYDVGIADLKYEVVQPTAENAGSYIFYAVDTDEDYNAECTLFNSVDTTMVNIEWHRVYRNGRVKSPVYFGDEVWHCWDENLNNIECP